MNGVGFVGFKASDDGVGEVGWIGRATVTDGTEMDVEGEEVGGLRRYRLGDFVALGA